MPPAVSPRRAGSYPSPAKAWCPEAGLYSVAQDLQIFMTKESVMDGFNLVARLGNRCAPRLWAFSSQLSLGSSLVICSSLGLGGFLSRVPPAETRGCAAADAVRRVQEVQVATDMSREEMKQALTRTLQRVAK